MTMKRRTFLLGSLSGLTLLAVSACTPEPQPLPTPTPTVPPTHSKIPQPSAFRRSDWAGDPFSRGAFSFQRVGSTPEQREILATPVAQRVFLAGEHTDLAAPATLQGARASGLRAARDIIELAGDGERIAVIGAGLAGAVAARRLADAGHSVVVIEGRDRAGGRILSVDGSSDESYFELGAMWLRDAPMNPLYTALDVAGVTTRAFTFAEERRTAEGGTTEPGTIAPDAVAAAITWAASQLGDVALADALLDSGAANLDASPRDDGVSEADLLENFVASDVVVASGADADALSSWFAGELIRSRDDDRLITGELSNVVTQLLEGIDVLPSSTVASMSYGENGVSLRLSRGESLSADRVVVTVPLGVLQSGSLSFDPPLPFTHRGAISALGMGQLETVVLRFDEPFWSTEATVWSVVDGDTDFPLWFNLLPATGEPVLVGLIGGEAVARLAELDDSAFLDGALASLEPFLDESLVDEGDAAPDAS